jgi:hypothetical protein
MESREVRDRREMLVWMGLRVVKVPRVFVAFRVQLVSKGRLGCREFKVRRGGLVRMVLKVSRDCKVVLEGRGLRGAKVTSGRMASREARACKVGRVSAPRVLLGRRETWVLRESKGSRGM